MEAGMSVVSDSIVKTQTLQWLKTPSSIEKEIINEIDDLDSSKIAFDFSRYNITSRMRLSKISRGIHSKAFNDLLMSYVKAGRYPLMIKDVLAGKESASQRNIHDIATMISSNPKLLKDFVVYALVKELEATSEIAGAKSLPEPRAEQLETMINCFDGIYRQLFSTADSRLKEVLADAIRTDLDIVKLVRIQPRRKGFNGIHIIFSLATLFIVLYSTAFFFIDAEASWLAVKKFLGVD